MSNLIDNRFVSFKMASIRVGERILFSNTEWTFASDQHWALLGDNGSGKSIFASALKGDLPVASGEIHYHFQAKDGELPENAIVHVSFDQYERFVESYRAYSNRSGLDLSRKSGAFVLESDKAQLNNCAQFCGSSCSICLAGWVRMRISTSLM
jgi:ATPase subunit of ABC transporter with duplicated ATPase domains